MSVGRDLRVGDDGRVVGVGTIGGGVPKVTEAVWETAGCRPSHRCREGHVSLVVSVAVKVATPLALVVAVAGLMAASARTLVERDPVDRPRGCRSDRGA